MAIEGTVGLGIGLSPPATAEPDFHEFVPVQHTHDFGVPFVRHEHDEIDHVHQLQASLTTPANAALGPFTHTHDIRSMRVIEIHALGPVSHRHLVHGLVKSPPGQTGGLRRGHHSAAVIAAVLQGT